MNMLKLRTSTNQNILLRKEGKLHSDRRHLQYTYQTKDLYPVTLVDACLNSSTQEMRQVDDKYKGFLQYTM